VPVGLSEAPKAQPKYRQTVLHRAALAGASRRDWEFGDTRRFTVRAEGGV
jgi:hypothetical protein